MTRTQQRKRAARAKRCEPTGWEWRDRKKLPTDNAAGQNAVQGLMPASIFKRRRTALTGVTSKSGARMRLLALRRKGQRRSAARLAKRDAVTLAGKDA